MKSNNSTKSNIFLIVLIFVFLGCEKTSKNVIKLDSTKLNEIMNRYVDEGIYPFLFARIEGDHGVIYEHSVVNKKILGDINVNADTYMRIWSMSKLVTISIAMDLIEDGLLSVNDPVIKYIPEFKNLKVAVDRDQKSISHPESILGDCPHRTIEMETVMTVRHLMNHTAGFYYAFTNSNCLNSSLGALNIPLLADSEELVKALIRVPLIQHPGERYHYGLNTAVLGIVIERITGNNLGEIFQKRVAEKLDLSGLQYTNPDGVKLIPGFTGRNGYLEVAGEGDLPIFGLHVPTYKSDQKLFLGGVGMLGTARGYIEFLRLLLDPRKSFLSESTLHAMTSKPPEVKSKQGYQTGYAFYITGEGDTYKNEVLTVGGYEFTKGWVDRENNIIGVLFSQVNGTTDGEGLGSRMENEFKEELFNQLMNQ